MKEVDRFEEMGRFEMLDRYGVFGDLEAPTMLLEQVDDALKHLIKEFRGSSWGLMETEVESDLYHLDNALMEARRGVLKAMDALFSIRRVVEELKAAAAQY